MLTIIGGINEFERSLIRYEEGIIARAKRKGTKFGRPTRLDEGEKRKIAERYIMAELATEYEVGSDDLEGTQPFRGKAKRVRK